MRKWIVLLVIFFTSSSYASSLSCSAKGTDVYYVNGILTSQKKNEFDKDKIEDLINVNNIILDSGPKVKGLPPVNYIGIHNPSFGAVNDAAELFAQAYYIKTGKTDNVKAIYNVIKNLPEATIDQKKLYDPNGFFATIARFTTNESVNYATLQNIAKEADKVALERSIASADTLVNENNVVSAKVRLHLIASRYANRKVLVVAHSQGNAVVNSAFRQISDYADSSGSREEINYLSKYGGVFHVASPVTPLSSPFKSRSIRSKQDKMIDVAQRLGLPAASISHEVVSRTTSDFSGHLFFDTYLSPDVLVRPINSTATPVKMSDVFVNNLSDLATDLESNCSEIKINVTPESIGLSPYSSNLSEAKFEYSFFTGIGNAAIFNIYDLSDYGSVTEFKYNGPNGTTIISNQIALPIPTPTENGFNRAHSISIYAKNKVTGNERYFTVYVSVPMNRAPQKISKWYAACQSGGTRPDGTTRPEGIANGNLLWFYADFADESFGNSGRTFLDGDQTIGVSTFEFYSENTDYMISDGMGGEITVKTPSNPCEVDTPVSLYGRSE